MAIPEFEKTVSDLTAQTGLMWRFTHEFADVPDFHITSSTRDQRHHVVFPTYYKDADEVSQADMLKSMCLGKLAESYDPLFATLRFPQEMNTDSLYNQQQAQRLVFAQYHTAVWANDLMRTVRPDLAKYGAENLVEVLQSMTTMIPVEKYAEEIQKLGLQIPLGYAEAFALVTRGNYEHLQEPMIQFRNSLNALPRPAQGQIDQLALHYAFMDTLPGDRDGAITHLESTTKRSCAILELPIHPQIITDGDHAVWTFDGMEVG